MTDLLVDWLTNWRTDTRGGAVDLWSCFLPEFVFFTFLLLVQRPLMTWLTFIIRTINANKCLLIHNCLLELKQSFIQILIPNISSLMLKSRQISSWNQREKHRAPSSCCGGGSGGACRGPISSICQIWCCHPDSYVGCRRHQAIPWDPTVCWEVHLRGWV